MVTSRLTDIAGSSKYLTGSIVCYSNTIKTGHVGVPEEVIEQYGAVSQQTAIAMATGIRSKFKTDLGVSITGIAGPDGGTLIKPVGLVYIAIDGAAGVQCFKHNFTGQRTGIKHRTALAAMDYIRRYVLLL